MFASLAEIPVVNAKSMKSSGVKVIRQKTNESKYDFDDFRAYWCGNDITELMTTSDIIEEGNKLTVVFDYTANQSKSFNRVLFVADKIPQIPKEDLDRKIGNGISVYAGDTLQIKWEIDFEDQEK